MEPGSLVQLSSEDGYDFIHVGECDSMAMRDTWEVPVGTIALVLGDFKGTSQSPKLKIMIGSEVGWVYPEEVIPVYRAR